MKMAGDFVTSNPKIAFGMLVTAVGGLVTLLWGKNWKIDEQGRPTVKATSHHKVTRVKGKNVEIKTQTNDSSNQEISHVEGKEKVSIETSEITAATTLQPQPQNNVTPATQPQNNTTPTTPPTIERKEEKKDEPGKTLSGSAASFLNNLSPAPPPTPSLDSQMAILGK